MDFEIPSELQMLARTIREYVQNRLEPISRQVEEEERIPPEIIREMAELGFFGIPFPEKYGGLGAGELGYCLALEELGATNACYSNMIGASVGLCGMAIHIDGTEDQKRRYLAPIAAGKKIGCFALSEPNAGTDAAALETTAVKRGDRYVLNGTKMFATNGPIADVAVVFAATDRSLGARGITAFILEPSFPGFQVGKIDQKMGLHGSLTGELIFQDCEVPEENVLAPVGRGFVTAMKTLDVGRVSLAAGAVGSSKKLLELSISYSKQRNTFGRPIATNQAIQWMVADMATEIHAARLMVYHAASRMDRGERVTTESAMVKLFATEMANRVADKAVQIYGGIGYIREFPVERFYRDARILRIYEGTSEAQRMVIAEALLKQE